MTAGPADFTRDHRPMATAPSSRATALVLTALLYVCFALLLGQPAFWAMPDKPVPIEIVLSLLPDVARRVVAPPPLPFIAHLIRPRVQTAAPPEFTVAADAAPAPAALPASAAKTSPLDGGAPDGTGAVAQAASSNGGNGAGTALSACFDAQWMQAASDRVRRFLYYPREALARHVTGLAMVHVIVRRNGYADLLEIGKSSGSRTLDAAAYWMVHKALPLPEIPDRMHTDKVEVLVPIDFGTGYHNTIEGTCRD
ncbi:MAG TPA: TonB family protein [Rhizomicrobium sp.]|jgi:protein TonB